MSPISSNFDSNSWLIPKQNGTRISVEETMKNDSAFIQSHFDKVKITEATVAKFKILENIFFPRK